MYKFLVAEDSKVILRDIVHLINEAGYDSVIKTAYDGEAAAELLKDFEPDIIFTDIDLSRIGEARTQLPMLSQRREDIYELRLL